MPLEKKLIHDIQNHAEALAEAMAKAEVWHKAYIQSINNTLKSQLEESQSKYEQEQLKLRSNHQRAITQIQQDLISLEYQLGLWNAPWDTSIWQNYECNPEAKVPYLTRIGQLEIVGMSEPASRFFENSTQLLVPAVLPVIGGKNLLIKASGNAKALAVQGLQSLLLRLIATIPSGKFRLLLIDPVGLGRNVAGFMHLADHMEELVGGKAWTEPTHIEQKLADYSEHMETVIQKYLRNRYLTMEDYNAEAGEVAEPYRLVVAMNFPVNFNDVAARRLVSIATNGPRCGVYVLATIDMEQPLPYGFNLGDLERVSTIISDQDDRFVWHDPDFQESTLKLDVPPPNGQFEDIVKRIGESAKTSNTVQVPFEKLLPKNEDWWQGDTCNGISVPIGRVGARGVQNFEVGEGTAQHALIAGRTGSGKSNLLHILINGLAIIYPPEELELYLVDFKKGVEFKTYASRQLPHARVIAIESEREFGLSVLEGLDSELTRRGETFRHAGYNNFNEYRQKTGTQLPRILLLVDEFQEFFVNDDKIAMQANLILDRLARQGRAFGIHILLGSQTLAGAYSLAHSTMDQMAVRIALQCSDSDSRLILADDNPAARLLSRPGEAIYNASSGLVEGNTLFQIAWLSDKQKDVYPQYLERLSQQHPLTKSSPIVFEGNQPADIKNNELLQQLTTTGKRSTRERGTLAWLGEAIAIKPPTMATFRRVMGSNLLILGRDEGLAAGMITSTLISIASQCTPNEVRLVVIDLATHDASWAEVIEDISRVLPHKIERLGRRDVIKVIDELEKIISQRTLEPTQKSQEVYLLILGLHRLRDLQRQDDLYFSGQADDTSLNPSQQFTNILQEGPEVNVHTIAWCDTYVNLQKFIDRRALQEFGMRVALPMSPEESSNFLDEPGASKLDKPNRALFYYEERIGVLEKFRPYQVPDRTYLIKLGKELQCQIVDRE